jgi:hypothetical protein
VAAYTLATPGDDRAPALASTPLSAPHCYHTVHRPHCLAALEQPSYLGYTLADCVTPVLSNECTRRHEIPFFETDKHQEARGQASQREETNGVYPFFNLGMTYCREAARWTAGCGRGFGRQRHTGPRGSGLLEEGMQ